MGHKEVRGPGCQVETPGLPGAGEEEGRSVKADTALINHGMGAGATLSAGRQGIPVSCDILTQ